MSFEITQPAFWLTIVVFLLPIVWAAGGGPRRHFVLFPIVWHFRDDSADKSTTVATLSARARFEPRAIRRP